MVGIQELLSFADLCVKIMHVVSFSVCSCFDRRRKNLSAKFSSKSSIALWVDQMHLYISYIVVEPLVKGIHLRPKTDRGLKCLFLYTYNTFVTSKKWTASLKT